MSTAPSAPTIHTTLNQVAQDPHAANQSRADSLLRNQAGTLMLLEHFMRVAVTPCVLHMPRSTAPCSGEGQHGQAALGACCSPRSSSSLPSSSPMDLN